MDEQNPPAKPQIKITFPDEVKKQNLARALAIGLYEVIKILQYHFPNEIRGGQNHDSF